MSKPITPPPGLPLTLEQANELIYKLMARIAELEDRLNQNSNNSSKPPSTDGSGTPPARKRPASGKARGAQPGHKGQRRERHPEDDRLTAIPHYPARQCACCGEQVVSHDKPYRVHQVFDLPEVSYVVTEHQLYRGTCRGCVTTSEAALPDTVSHSQMGANLLSYIALQSGQFHQSISKITRLADETLQRMGDVDILVNNAGAAWGAPAEDHPADAWDKVMNLNVRGYFLLSQAIAKKSMIARRSGRIINIASIAGLGGNPSGQTHERPPHSAHRSLTENHYRPKNIPHRPCFSKITTSANKTLRRTAYFLSTRTNRPIPHIKAPGHTETRPSPHTDPPRFAH